MYKENKKIFIVAQNNLAYSIGGTVTVAINFCNMLACNGYSVNIIYYYDKSKNVIGLDKSVTVINLHYKYDGLNYSEAINKEVASSKPDILIFFFPRLYVDAKLSNEHDCIPRILMFHSRPDIYFSIDKTLSKKLEKLYKNTISQILFNSFKKLLPNYIKKSNIVTIPNGIKLHGKRIDNRIEKRKIIFLSSITIWKGVEFLIYAFKRIADKYPDWSLDIYGQCQPDNYIDTLTKLTKKLKLDSQIFFKGVTDTPIETLLDYDFCVFPSYFEGFPIGVIEAMSVGLPVIGLNQSSGVNELVINNYNGYLTQESYKDFAIKIENLILDKNKRIEFSKNALKVVSKYNIEKINNKWLFVIDELINKIPLKDNIELIKSKKSKISIFSIKKIINMQKHYNIKWYEHIFSVKNHYTNNRKKKVLFILGLRITM